GWLYEIS
nr:Chain B, Seven residue peptide [synthetic construct]